MLEISSERATTTFMPFPIDILRPFLESGNDGPVRGAAAAGKTHRVDEDAARSADATTLPKP